MEFHKYVTKNIAWYSIIDYQKQTAAKNQGGNHLLAFLATLLYRTKISEVCTGCWGFRGTVVKDLRLDAIGFDIEANLFAEIAKKGYRIAEVPIHYRRRSTPVKLSSLKDGLKISKTLIRKRFR